MCDLQDRGLLYADTPEQADADLEHVRRRVHAHLDGLADTIDHDRAVTLDNSVCDLQGAMQDALTARLVAALVAVNEGDSGVFVAPAHGRPVRVPAQTPPAPAPPLPDACPRCGLPAGWALKLRMRAVFASIIAAGVAGLLAGRYRRAQ